MKNKPGKPQPIYSDSFKLGIVMRIANGQLTKEEARIAYHFRSFQRMAAILHSDSGYFAVGVLTVQCMF